MKKALKYIAIVLISLLVLLLTLPLSIYIPAVQRWGKNEISGYVGRSTGMELSIGKLSLKFPFRLQIDDILLLTSSRDTLLQSSSIQVGVAPAALLRGQVQIQKIALNETLFRFSNSDSTLLLSANIKQFSTQKANVNLKDFHISLPSTRLDGGEITLNLSESSPDTVSAESAPLNWSISVGEIGLSNIHYSMQMKPTIENLDASIQKARLLQGEIDLYGQSVRVSEAIIVIIRGVEIMKQNRRKMMPIQSFRRRGPYKFKSCGCIGIMLFMPCRPESPKKGLTSGIFLSIILRLPSTPSIIEEAKYAFLLNNWRSPNVRG